MADWYGAARSNYVRLNCSVEAFREALGPFASSIRVSPSGSDSSRVCLLAETYDGGWPSFASDDSGEDLEFSFQEYVVPYLAEGQVLIVMQSGHEKLRYVDGHASAFAWDDREVHLGLWDIRDLAAKTFGIPAEQISEASY